jgi:hypothetical protein
VVKASAFVMESGMGVRPFALCKIVSLYPQKLTAHLRVVIKYLIVDGVRSVIGRHLHQLNVKFTPICAGGEVPDTPAEHDIASSLGATAW